MSTATKNQEPRTKNQERLAGIIAEIVTALDIDVGDCNLGPGPDICALGDEAVAALKARMGGTPSGRAEELITQLEAEIVKRDARIVELESRYQHDTPLHKAVFMVLESYTGSDSFDDGVRGLIAELAALKAQQPSGVVLPERKGMHLHHDSIMPTYSMAWNACLDEVARLNLCRAQSVPDGLTFNALRAANAARIGSSKYRKCEENWTPAHWMQATVGELGELANLLKKVDRGDFPFEQVKADVAKELADVQTYLDILALKLGVDLGRATIDKFNEVSARIGSNVMLAAAPSAQRKESGDE